MPASPRPPDLPGFEPAWAGAADIPGWLTEQQAALLYEQALGSGSAPRLLEIGSHQGRSTVVLATAASRLGGELVAVDPFVEGRLFGGASTRDRFESNLARAGLSHVVQLVADYSTKLRPSWTQDLDLLYIDGKHDYWTLSDDLRWSEHLRPDGAVLVHDAYSSIGVTLGILLRVLPSRTLRYERREGSLALFRKAKPTATDRLRILGEMPWWLRNVFLKVLLRLRLRSVARRFGHDSPYDPY
jgi:methyltransferase family protein